MKIVDVFDDKVNMELVRECEIPQHRSRRVYKVDEGIIAGVQADVNVFPNCRCGNP